MVAKVKAMTMDLTGLQIAWLVAAMLHLATFVALGISRNIDEDAKQFSIVNIRLGAGGQGLKLKKQDTSLSTNVADMAPAAGPATQPQQQQQIDPMAAPRPAPRPQQKAAAAPKPKAAPWRREREKGETARRGAPRTLEQYVAEGAKASSAIGTENEDDVMQRYTQVLSLWLYKYWELPPEMQVADGMVQAQIRIRIDRAGHVTGYRLEQSTGSPLLDESMQRMVQKAIPLPEVPRHYPGGSQLEFLIPIAITLG